MVFFHECLALGIAKNSSLAPDGFRNKKSWIDLTGETGGVELNKFHIHYFRTRLKSEITPVPRGYRRVCGIAVKLADTAGSHKDRLGPYHCSFTFNECNQAMYLTVFDDQFRNLGLFQEFDTSRSDLINKHGFNIRSRGIAAGMQDPGYPVGSFLCK